MHSTNYQVNFTIIILLVGWCFGLQYVITWLFHFTWKQEIKAFKFHYHARKVTVYILWCKYSSLIFKMHVMIKGFHKVFPINAHTHTHTHTQTDNYRTTEVHLINSFNIENNLDCTVPLLWMSSLKYNFHFSFSYSLTWKFYRVRTDKNECNAVLGSH